MKGTTAGNIQAKGWARMEIRILKLTFSTHPGKASKEPAMKASDWVTAALSLIAIVCSAYAYYAAKKSEHHSTVYRVTDRSYDIDKVSISYPRILIILKDNIEA